MSEASQILGVTVRTLQRWDQAGKAHFVRTPKGKRRLPEGELNRLLGMTESKLTGKNLVIYARVSSHEQKTKGDRSGKLTSSKKK